MIRNYLKLLRIKHWIKNGFVFVPLLFSKNLFDWDLLVLSVSAFFSFSFASSLVYVFNDIKDIGYDQNHPRKKTRPLASTVISIRKAYMICTFLAVLTAVSLILLNLEVASVVTAYVLLNIFYSIKLKNIVILDLIIIASGFVLRVISGAFAIDVQISSWLILTTLFLSIFLAVMKRRSEKLHLEGFETRSVLDDYSYNFIDQISNISLAGIVICYALYTVSDRTLVYFGTDKLIYTTIFVFYGVSRYLFLVHKKQVDDNIVEVLVNDKPMLINFLLYILVVLLIIY